jgi:hypothetical protein
MTFADLQKNVYRKTAYADSPSSDVVTRIKSFLNETNRRILGLPGLEYLRQTSTTFASVAATAEYSLPRDVQRIINMRDASNDLTLVGKPWNWYTANVPDPTDLSGIPAAWCPIGIVAVDRQPSAACKAYVTSTAAGDTGSAYVEGLRTGGYPFAATVTMNGITAVQVGAYTDIISITKFYISAAAAGTVTLYEFGQAWNISTIQLGKTQGRYFRVALWPTPSSAVTYTVDYQRSVPDMVNDNDEPLLPEDFHWLLSSGARMMEYELQDDRRFPAAKMEYDKGVRDLKWFVTQQADGRDGPVPMASNLGPWYPAGA